MRNGFPIVVCIAGAIADFAVWGWLRSVKVRDKVPASLAHLTHEERQRRITVAGQIIFGSAWFFLAGAVLLWWLGTR
jgi:hypothetical protein